MIANEIKPLADAIYLTKVLDARRIPAGDKIRQALELYDANLSWMKAGIEAESPGIEPNLVEEIVQERIRKLRCLSDYKIFHKLEVSE